MSNQSLVFQSIVSHMVEGVIFIDQDDQIQVCNPAAERIRGVNAEKIMGKSIYNLHPPHTHTRIKNLIANLRSGELASSNRIIRVRDRYFDNSYSAIRDPEGEYLGTLLLSRDVTEVRRLSQENIDLKAAQTAPSSQDMICRSPAMQKALEIIDAVAPLDSTVLVTGESGVGKERAVEMIHRRSERRENPLVMVNCAALPENLIESELFGHAKGAFTGAVEKYRGKFAQAHGGTLFLDEIGEMPLAAQAKLLRAIQEKVVHPVGSSEEIRVDVRIVAATNQSLEEMVAERRFREDLYYRLNVITLELPPLRERREDVLPLAERFIQQYCEEMSKPIRCLSPQAAEVLLTHTYPGNVRQLKHALERAVALGTGEVIIPEDLPSDFVECDEKADGISYIPGKGLREANEGFEREYLLRALRHHDGKKTCTAKALGISRKSLWEKLQRHGLDVLGVT